MSDRNTPNDWTRQGMTAQEWHAAGRPGWTINNPNLARPTVQPLPKSADSIVGPLRTKLNKGLMIQWINADLLERARFDVRRAIVFYDDQQTFETAMLLTDWNALGDKREAFLERLYAATPVRYWSKGVK